MTCNIVKSKRVTRRELLESIHGHEVELSDEDDVVVTEHGETTYFICGDLEIDVCACCGVEPDFLCDYPIGGGKTCDLPLCSRCKRSIGEDRDLCPVHHAQFVGAQGVNPWPPKRGPR